MDCGGGRAREMWTREDPLFGKLPNPHPSHFAHMNRTGVNQTVGSRSRLAFGGQPHDNSSGPRVWPRAQLAGIPRDRRPRMRSARRAKKINKGNRGEETRGRQNISVGSEFFSGSRHGEALVAFGTRGATSGTRTPMLILQVQLPHYHRHGSSPLPGRDSARPIL